jgi:hypothetical protein
MTDRPGFEFLRLTRSVYSMVYDIAYKSNYKISGPIGDRPGYHRLNAAMTHTDARASSIARPQTADVGSEPMSTRSPSGAARASPSFLLIFRQILNPFGVKALCKAKCYPNS